MSETCIVLDVSGDFAHFRKPHTTSPAQTFGVPPRTTIAGMIAGMLGLGRDSYYDLFSRERSRVAVSLERPIRRLSLGINILTTEGKSTKTGGAQPGKQITGPRQQNVFEVLCEPAYRLYVSLNDEALMNRMAAIFAAGKCTYTLTLGLSEHLACFEYHGRHEIEFDTGQATVRSVVPGESIGLVPDPEARYVTERSPAFMRAHEPGGRVADGSQTLTYDRRGEPMELRETEYATIGGDTVVFSPR